MTSGQLFVDRFTVWVGSMIVGSPVRVVVAVQLSIENRSLAVNGDRCEKLAVLQFCASRAVSDALVHL